MVVFLPPAVKEALNAKGGPRKWALAFLDAHKRRTERWYKPNVPFPVGQKQIFLPNFTVTMIRKPKHSPYFATFKVPLYFNKLDLRDYLFNAYSVRVRGISSQIKEFRPTNNERDYGRMKRYRPQSQKTMTAELVRPFVWPEAPKGEELEKWDHSRSKDLLKMQEKRNLNPTNAEASRNERRKVFREKAQRLLSGTDKWKEVDASSIAEARTVELPVR